MEKRPLLVLSNFLLYSLIVTYFLFSTAFAQTKIKSIFKEGIQSESRELDTEQRFRKDKSDFEHLPDGEKKNAFLRLNDEEKKEKVFVPLPM